MRPSRWRPTAQARRGEYGVDDHRLGAGPVPLTLRARPVLRRPGTPRTCCPSSCSASRSPALSRWRGSSSPTASRSATAAAPTLGGAASPSPSSRRRRQGPEGQHPRDGVRDVPAHLRDHHAGTGDRRLRRARSVLRHPDLFPAVAPSRLCADRALGLGRRLARQDGAHGFRRRDRGASSAGMAALSPRWSSAGAGLPGRPCRRTT